MRSSPFLTILPAFLAALSGCTGLPTVPALPEVPLTLPGRYTIVREQFIIHSDFPLAPRHRLVEELAARRHDLSCRLELPASGELTHVYLFGDADRFHRFMRLYHPDFPQRRAFFVETDTRLIVYAYWGDRVAEDLRHEVSHGYLHSVVPYLPLWLDEGLAEFFEVPRGRNGINRTHLDRLRVLLQQDNWHPDLRRLERLDSPFGMTQDDYAEAWAWVHFLLHSGPEYGDLLRGYLRALRRDGSAEPLSVGLGPRLEQSQQALAEYVRLLNEGCK